MTDLLPWILLLVVIAAIAGYVLGARASAGSPSVPAPGPGRAAAPSPAKPADATLRGRPTTPQPARREVPGTATATATATDPARPLAAARSWGYQLQSLNLARAEASPFDMLVIDPAKDGSDATALRPAEIERLKRKPDGQRRLVIAYCSVGEAESYRGYWQKGWARNKPGWLLGENPEWAENYSVCFWEPEWQALFCGSAGAVVDRIIAQGFDGLYLDKCDVYEDLREHFKPVARTRPGMEADMIAFVRRISSYAKAKRPGFQIIMQNAEPLLEARELRDALDGVAKEELLFGLDRPEKPNTRDEIEESRRLLDLLQRDGKPVFSVEYLDAKPRIADAAERTRQLGYVLYIAPKDRELDQLRYHVAEA